MSSQLPDPAEAARVLQRSASRLTRRLLATRPPGGLSAGGLALLARLRQDGPASASALAAQLRVRPQSLTRALAQLERRGLIRRAPHAADRRRSLIALTEAGAAALGADLEARRARLAQAIAATLSPAEQALLGIAAGLIDRLAEALEPGAP
jgi:DNA-binding MarR family transcriptional regulator